MSTDERQPDMQARHRSKLLCTSVCVFYRCPGQLNRLCYVHVNQQAELADSKGVELEFQATNLLQLKQM